MIELIFEQFERLGTINGVLRTLVHHQIQLPQRVASGDNKGGSSGVGPIATR